MPRNSSGLYTLPLGNPVIDGTIIDTNWANPTMSDIAVQLNNVLTRDGLLGPVLPFYFVDGTPALPGIAFASSNSTGIWKDVTQIGISYQGQAKQTWHATGSTLIGQLSITDIANVPLKLTGTTSGAGVAAEWHSSSSLLRGVVGSGPAAFGVGAPTTLFGIRSEAEFGIFTGGANERIRIDAAGLVGIGQVPLAPFKLAVNGQFAAVNRIRLVNTTNQSGGSLTVDEGVTQGMAVSGDSGPLTFLSVSERMRINPNGNVGIGVIDPTAALEVGRAAGAEIALRGGGRTYADSYGIQQAADGSAYVFNKANQALVLGTNNAVRLHLEAGGNVSTPGQIRALGWFNDALGTLGGPACEIGVSGGNAIVVGYDRIANSYVPLIVGGSSVALQAGGSTAVSVLPTGHVGIGVANPQARLHVQDLAASEVLRLSSTGSPYMTWYNNTSAGSIGYVGNGTLLGQAGTDFGIRAEVNLAFGIGANMFMKIAVGGNVGIGNNNPLTAVVVERNTAVTTVNAQPFFVARNRAVFTGYAGGLLSDSFRDIADPHYAAGVWFEKRAIGGGLSSEVDLVFGAMASNAANTMPTPRMRVHSSGAILMGVNIVDVVPGGIVFDPGPTSIVYHGHAVGSAAGAAYQSYYYGAGTIGSISQVGTTGVAYNTTSDERLKTAIVEAPFLSSVDAIRIREFEFRSEPGTKRVGVIAQELYASHPEAVTVGGEDVNKQPWSVDYSKLVPMLVQEIQNLRARLEAAGL